MIEGTVIRGALFLTDGSNRQMPVGNKQGFALVTCSF